MLRLHQIKLTPDEALSNWEERLRRICAKRLKINENEILSLKIAKRSVDARRDGVYFAYTLDLCLRNTSQEAVLASRFQPNEASFYPTASLNEKGFSLLKGLPPYPQGFERPVVVGAGPAGLFCALALALRGARPLLIERGKPVEERANSISLLEESGILDTESNVLFGEGGAGAFSDGKLTCGLNSPLTQTVLEILCECGAPREILTDAKPHIGTDELRKVLVQLRKKIQAAGGEIRFGCKMRSPMIREESIRGVVFEQNGAAEEFPCTRIYLAIGHSARDTFQVLYDKGVMMAQKPFAVGVRIEHLQESINRAQYGSLAGHKALPPADYKLNIHTPDGRGVYTFCMCPGGQVINASSELGGINVNGMSLHARNGKNANAALLVGVSGKDYGSEHPLAGLEFQRKIEQKAFAATSSLKAPCQTVGDFLAERETKAFGSVLPSYRPGVSMGTLYGIFPDYITDNLRYALPLLGKKLKGFDHPEALLTGPETRSSSPVRILREKNMESCNIKGLYPIGEGAGYAGGIVSAALDGLKAGMNE